MPTEQLELRTHEAMFGQIRHQLMPKQMGIDTLGNPCGARVLSDNLAQTPGRVGPDAIGFEEIRASMLLLPFEVLGEFPPETGRKEHVAILVAFALGNADLAALQIDIGRTKVHEFGITHTREEQE